MVELSKVLNFGVMPIQELSSGALQKSARKYMLAEFRQDIKYATINGKDDQGIRSHLTVIGIEGEVRDYILTLNYPSQETDNDPKLTQDLKMLRSLVSSFRPLKVVDPHKELTASRIAADSKFQEIMLRKGKEIFWLEFSSLLMRLKSLDLASPDNRLQAMKLLKPFELFAKEINLQNKYTDRLWDALNKSEIGDSAEFMKVLHEGIELASKDMANSEPSRSNESTETTTDS